MKNYDKIDPEQYEARHEKSRREGYLRDHWRPLIAAMISQYCKDKTVVDLGCGAGAYTTIIAKYSNRVLGLDISMVMLSYAKNKHANLNLALADAHHIPLKTESMEIVVCIGLFEYIERTTVLEEINRVLNRDSICIIQCPNKFSAVRVPTKLILRVLGRQYLAKEPSYGEMLRLFKQNGLKVIESRMDDGLIWLPDFIDRLTGRRIYLLIEKIFSLFGRNPFSNVMLFVGRKRGGDDAEKSGS